MHMNIDSPRTFREIEKINEQTLDLDSDGVIILQGGGSQLLWGEY